MKKNLFTFLLFFMTNPAMQSGLCFPLHRVDTKFFHLYAEDKTILNMLSKNADTIAEELCNEMGFQLAIPVNVRIASTVKQFHDIQPQGTHVPTWAIGVAYPSRNLIVLLSPRSHMRGSINLIKTFRHELAHIVIGKIFRGKQRVPRWLDEGIAMIVARQWNLSRLSTMTWAVLTDSLIPIREITDSFPADPSYAELAYCESFYFISFLKGKFGSALFQSFLREYSKNKNFEGAIKNVYHINWYAMEKLWLNYLKLRFSWIPIATSSTTLWFVISILFIIGYIRKKRATRVKLQQWEQQERIQYPNNHNYYH